MLVEISRLFLCSSLTIIHLFLFEEDALFQYSFFSFRFLSEMALHMDLLELFLLRNHQGGVEIASFAHHYW